MREDITEREWTTYFDNFEANQIRAAEEVEAARIKEIEEEKANEAEFARILAGEPPAALIAGETQTTLAV